MATILVVDDSQEIRHQLMKLLGEKGHRILQASNGIEGLDLAKTQRPHLIITDIVMPQIDGYELVRQLRSDPAVAGTAVIFYTGTYQEKEAVDLARHCGVSNLLYKPCKLSVILQAVEQALKVSPPALPHQPPPEFEREHLRLVTDKLAAKIQELENEVAERKQAESRLADSLEQLHAFAGHLQTIREEERARIAREIHDELGQALTGLKLDLGWVKRQLAKEGGRFQPVQDRVSVMSDFLDATIKKVRHIATELRPVVLDELTLSEAIEWQAQEFRQRTGIFCTVRHAVDNLALDSERCTAIFRICQEALTNVIRHAAATAVLIDLRIDNNIVVLEVADNGRGLVEKDPKQKRSLGLIGMRERARSFGGQVTVSGARQGTQVVARIPIGPLVGDKTHDPSDNRG